MSKRFLISLVCVGAVAFACGPRAHNEASAPKKNGSSETESLAKATPSPSAASQRVTKRASRAAREHESPVAAHLYVRGEDANLRLVLHVINAGTKRVELTFPSGKTYDFVILDSIGREVWRWGSGRMFTQALRTKQLSGGEAMNLEETWQPASLSPGRYTARATLESANYPLMRETQFTVSARTVASR